MLWLHHSDLYWEPQVRDPGMCGSCIYSPLFGKCLSKQVTHVTDKGHICMHIGGYMIQAHVRNHNHRDKREGIVPTWPTWMFSRLPYLSIKPSASRQLGCKGNLLNIQTSNCMICPSYSRQVSQTVKGVNQPGLYTGNLLKNGTRKANGFLVWDPKNVMSTNETREWLWRL